MESLNLSFFRRALHTAHDRIHMFLLPVIPIESWTRGSPFGMQLGCHLIVKRISRTRASATYHLFIPESRTPRSTTVSLHNHCVNRIKTVSHARPTTLHPWPSVAHRFLSSSGSPLRPMDASERLPVHASAWRRPVFSPPLRSFPATEPSASVLLQSSC